MPSVEELEDAIRQLERMPSSFDNCLRLATYKYLLNSVTRDDVSGKKPLFTYDSDSEFMQVAKTISLDHLLETVDELLGCVQMVSPSIYTSTMLKLKDTTI